MTKKGSDKDACRLYLITPPVFDPLVFRDILSAALDADDVAAMQLRLTDTSDATFKRAIDLLRPVAQERGVAFLLHDRPDLALAHGCDGAHLDADLVKIQAARRMLGDLTLGVFCQNSREVAFDAGESGADYVAFGAFLPPATSEVTGLPEPDILAWWAEMMEVPCVASGGITAENCAPLVQAGADFLAVGSAVWNHPQGAAQGVRSMNAAIQAAISD